MFIDFFIHGSALPAAESLQHFERLQPHTTARRIWPDLAGIRLGDSNECTVGFDDGWG